MMPEIDDMRNTLVSSFYDNSVMLNIAMNIEAFLCDDVMLYPYKNWDKAEIVSGPIAKRYFVSVVFRFEYEEMPDPYGIQILNKFGVNVRFKKVKEKALDLKASKEKNEKVDKIIQVWYVQLDIPRELVSDERQREHISKIEDLLDIEAIEDVADSSNDASSLENDSFGSDFGGDFGGGLGGGGGDFGDDDFDMGDEPMDEPEPEPEPENKGGAKK